MCGIWFYIHQKNYCTLTQGQIYDAFMKTKHRGPDNSTLLYLEKYGIYIGFHRLSINGLSHNGNQPFIHETDDMLTYCICNGEIYNYKELAKKYNIELTTGSDCEILIPLYKKLGSEFVKELNAEFSFAIISLNKKSANINIFVSRDSTGKRGLFYSVNNNEFVLSSELKGIPFLENTNYITSQFPPRSFMEIESNNCLNKLIISEKEYVNFEKIKISYTRTDLQNVKNLVFETFINSVKYRLMSDRPVYALLSGGLDSSLYVAVLASLMKAEGKKLRTVCIGLPESTDAKYAQIVADYCQTEHTLLTLTQQQFIDAVPEVIKSIESYDVTTVRASVGQWLVSKWISENTDAKVVYVGDGSDELTSGYMYSHKAPSLKDLDNDSKRLMNEINFFDGLRCDRCVSAHGLEARLAYLDDIFIKTYYSIDPELRAPTNGKEKWLLRESFKESKLLPEQVLFRQKEAFSDGVSGKEKSWFKILQEDIETRMSEEEIKTITNIKYPFGGINTKEAIYYKYIFRSYYGNNVWNIIPHYWMPQWSDQATDPSARTLDVYNQFSD
jgi:asparagine synthase (glutamine-hydrolysing)